jgi:hypothetical protein
MKFVYGIAGFATGLMAGLLLVAIETNLLIKFQGENVRLVVMGSTVFLCVVTGVITGISMAKKRIG